VTETQGEELGRVRAVHVIPSGDVAATSLETVAPETATKIPFPYLSETQGEELGRVRAVHVIPSGEVAAILVFLATVTKIPFP